MENATTFLHGKAFNQHLLHNWSISILWLSFIETFSFVWRQYEKRSIISFNLLIIKHKGKFEI